jgi:hypothetical protein
MRRLWLTEAESKRNLLVDSNLLVLFIVGSVRLSRITHFKRTSKYTVEDYFLLKDVMGQFGTFYTVAHVMSEVSNLTDLAGLERLIGREVLKQFAHLALEPGIQSVTASRHQLFPELGLTDAAIATAARAHDCVVLTDDLPLYLRLSAVDVSVINYAHLRERFGIV